MKSRLGWRARVGALGTVLALAVTGLMIAGPSAQAVSQNGPRNYVGPGDPPGVCPLDATDCFLTTGNVDVVQTQTDPDLLGAGRYNRVVLRGQSTTANQTGAPNTATCSQSSNAAGTEGTPAKQSCVVTQSGDGGNTVIANMVANPSTDSTLGGSITQNVGLVLKVIQTSDSGSNTVRGSEPGTSATLNVDEFARQELSTNANVQHLQRSFEFAYVNQNSGSGLNSISLTLNRTQNSFTRGATPTQKQDDFVDPAPAEMEGLCDNAARNGNACIVQNSVTGQQSTKIRALDRKIIDAQNVPLGNEVTQQQGPVEATGGWLTEVKQDSKNNPAGGTVDLGEECLPGPAQQPPDGTTDCHNTSGVGKWWTMDATNLLDGPVGGNSSQNDGILDNLIGKSPCSGRSNAWTFLEGRTAGGADPGTVQRARLDAVGHTKTLEACSPPAGSHPGSSNPGWKGSISAQLNDFGKRINFDSTSVSAHIGCDDHANGAATACATSENIEASPTTFSAIEGVPFENQTVATFTGEGQAGDYSATVNWGDGSPTEAAAISESDGSFTVAGGHTYTAPGSYDVPVTITRNGTDISADVVSKATVADVSCPTGCFVIGRADGTADLNEAAYFWGNEWAVKNVAAPSSFKGFAASPTDPCSSTTWSSKGGTSPPPSGSLPEYMAVIVTPKVLKAGSAVKGDIWQIVVVKSDPGYTPNSGGVGTGTVVGRITCPG